MTSKNKEFTWRKLKKLCDSIGEDFMDKPVCAIGEERGFTIDGGWKFKEPWANVSGDGIEPVSVYREQAKEENDPEILKDALAEVIYTKGHPALGIDGITSL